MLVFVGVCDVGVVGFDGGGGMGCCVCLAGRVCVFMHIVCVTCAALCVV